MSERGRAGLTNLKRPLVQTAAPAVPMEVVEERLLGGAGAGTEAAPEPADVPAAPAVHTEVLPDILLNRKPREPLVAWTLKLPVSLHRELKQVAHHNDIGMTSIVVDALKQYLPRFPHPEK